jgi:AcrR family transcriptional regulator
MLKERDGIIPSASQMTDLSTRERILLEASRLFARKGYHGTSTREIAAAVRIQQPSLFHHFPSKRAIMAELIDIDHAEAAATAKREADAPGSAAVRLYRYLVTDIAFICRCAYDLSSVEVVLHDPEFSDKQARHEELQGARRRIIEEGIRTGEFVADDVSLAHKMIIWILRGDIVDSAGQALADAERIAQQLASFILRALLADPDQLGDIRTAAEKQPRP